MLGLALFLSGAAGLMYELVWIRALGLAFGTSTPAVSIVLGAFMAGLSAGSLVLGRAADRWRRPLVAYQVLEVSIAVTGTLTSLFLLHARGAMAALARAADGSILQLAACMAILCVPTMLMGATIPLLSRTVATLGTAGRSAGWVYAANTGGAVLGALLPDLLLIPTIGLTATVLVAAVANLSAALVARFVPLAVEAPEPAAPLPARRSALVLFGASGFAAMGYEILWSRLVAHWSLSWSVSFAALLGIYLLAVAVGARAGATWADRVKNPLTWAGILLATSALCAVLPIVFGETWRDLLEVLQPRPGGTRTPVAFVVVRALLCSSWLCGPACLAMGAAFPFLVAGAAPQGSVGRDTGWLYACNTLFGVAGAIATGFVLVPHLGLQGALFLLATASAATALLTIPRRRWVPALALGALALSWKALPSDHVVRIALPRSIPSEDIRAVREGSSTTVAVIDERAFGRPVNRALITPGVSMSDTSLSARRYMGLMGHLPLLFAARPERALLICYGVGNTARSLLSHPSLEELHVVDISSEVLAMSPLFAEVTGSDPLLDPRVRVTIDDGRRVLLVDDATYDVITAEPPPPHNAGVTNLYSREFYEVARRRLAPGGVLAQWLPVFQLSDDDTGALIAAFTESFPYSALAYGHAQQWILLGSDRPLLIDPARWDAIAREPTVSADLQAIGVGGVEDLFATHMASGEELKAVASAYAPLTDDRPTVQYPDDGVISLTLPLGLRADPSGFLAALPPGPGRDALLTRAAPAIVAMQQVFAVVPELGVGSRERQEVRVGQPLLAALRLRPGDEGILALLGLDANTVEAARDSGDPAAKHTLARAALYAGRPDDAAAATADSTDPADLVVLALAQLERGEVVLASQAFDRAVAASADPVFRSRARFDPVRGLTLE